MPRIEHAPNLIEEALFQRMLRAERDEPRLAELWQRERERLYARPPGAARDQAFRELCELWFHELGLSDPIRRAVQACPSANRRLGLVLVRAARSAREEGSELYHPGETETSGSQPRLVLMLRAQRYLDLDQIETWALRELLYADDMLDPLFGYTPELPPELDEEPARRELVRDRLTVLWRARIEGSLHRRRGGESGLEHLQTAFARAFRGLEEERLCEIAVHASSGLLVGWEGLVELACDAATDPRPFAAHSA